MYKIIYILLLFTYCTCGAYAQENEGIRFFEGTWEEALQQAKKEGKMIFVDCYSDWCGPCAAMVKKIFPLKEVGDFFNRHFINLKCNTRKGEEGKVFKEKFKVVALPTYLFISNDGFVALRGSGYKETKPFIALAEKAVAIGNNGKEARFVKGERDETFVKEYVKELLSCYQADAVESVLNQLYEEQGTGILNDKYLWAAFDGCAQDINTPLVIAVGKEYKKLCKIHGEYVVNQTMRNLYASISKTLALYDSDGKKEVINEEKKQTYFDLLKDRKLPNYKKMQQEIEFITLLRARKYEEAYAWGEQCLKKADARELSNWAALGERMVRGNKEVRLKMTEWIKRALELPHNDKIKEECENVLHDLETAEGPVVSKKARQSIPGRGFLRFNIK